jgi:hypothetical protein
MEGDIYRYYNPNPEKYRVGDCVIRALCKAFDQEWDPVYLILSAYGFTCKNMPSGNHVWGRLLADRGYKRHIMDCDCTVEDFAVSHQKGTYILALDGHVVCCKDGHYYDSWDSGEEIPLYYWEK